MKAAIEQKMGNKVGGQKGNTNSTRHGLSGGNLPKPFRYVVPSANELRRDLEEDVVAIRGEISVTDASAINRAFRWERAAQVHQALAARQSDAKGNEISQEAIATHIESAARCSDQRHKAIVDLKLEKPEADVWALPALPYVHDDATPDAACSPEPPDPGEQAGSAQNAAGAKSRNVEATPMTDAELSNEILRGEQ